MSQRRRTRTKPKPVRRVRKPAKTPVRVEPPAATAAPFPVVGIGASAGGLEALELFLRATPSKTGIAFVIVQHLDPKQHGMLPELLQRATAMPVTQALDGLRIAPDHVYVIPPNRDMSIVRGALQLVPHATPRGINLPIDIFLRSLADERQDRAIAVILSGMGSDGTLGARAIKEHAGAVFAQAQASAKFDAMPRSVIEAGIADVVAPVEELPAKIIAYHARVPHVTDGEQRLEDKAQSALDKICVLLRAQTGNDFSLYKKSTIVRRIERRMGLHQIASIALYVRFLRENPRELELLFKELLIGVTSFFRDPSSWDFLKQKVLSAMVAKRPQGGVMRAWVAGCSTGEEAYSLAIAFKEAIEPLRPLRSLSLQIFATDLDREAIEHARIGAYPNNIAADVSAERLRRFFIQDDHGFRVGKEIREMVVFAPQNVAADPPFTKLDILSCRNLLIYLGPELQKRLIPLFHYSLNPGGMLFLGSAETIGTVGGLFQSSDNKARIYRRLENSVNARMVTFPAANFGASRRSDDSEIDQVAAKTTSPNIQALADRVLVQRFSPLGMLCNDKGDILYISGRAGKYFEPAVGKANLNVFAMAREGLRYELSSAFGAALRQATPVVARNIKVGTNGDMHRVNLTVQRLGDPRELRGTVMIVVADAATRTPVAKAKPARRTAGHPHIAELQLELQRAHEEVQTTREEMQTSQEELRSTNEELQSTNEELQSSNEELTTSKEEMQSLNEELQTVNNELQAKVDELSRANNDMKNLLNSTDIATLFLDGELRVRRFTTQTAKIIKLIAADAGRPITDIASDLDYPELADDAREVLHTLVFKEKVAITRDGRWFLVRVMPYRTLENRIDGVVITFTDNNAARSLAANFREQADQLRQMAESLPILVWGSRPDGGWDYLSRQWVDYTGISEVEQLNYGWLEQVHPDDRQGVRERWRHAITGRQSFDAEFRLRNRTNSYRWFKTRSTPIRDSHGEVLRWYGTSTDVDDLKRS